jgi:uncharacterized protein
MKFENAFVVQAPIDEVYAALLDVERVAPCMPGAEVVEKTADDAYKVAIKVKVGPMSMTYKGDVQIVERDDAAKTATLRAKAKESRGQGTADADVTMVLSGENGRTTAKITTEVDLSGKVATMGAGVLQDVSGRLVKTFATNLATMLEGGTDAQPDEPAKAASAATKAPPPQADDALDLGNIGGAMVQDKLQSPRNLGLVVGVALLVAYLLGRRSRR